MVKGRGKNFFFSLLMTSFQTKVRVPFLYNFYLNMVVVDNVTQANASILAHDLSGAVAILTLLEPYSESISTDFMKEYQSNLNSTPPKRIFPMVFPISIFYSEMQFIAKKKLALAGIETNLPSSFNNENNLIKKIIDEISPKINVLPSHHKNKIEYSVKLMSEIDNMSKEVVNQEDNLEKLSKTNENATKPKEELKKKEDKTKNDDDNDDDEITSDLDGTYPNEENVKDEKKKEKRKTAVPKIPISEQLESALRSKLGKNIDQITGFMAFKAEGSLVIPAPESGWWIVHRTEKGNCKITIPKEAATELFAGMEGLPVWGIEKGLRDIQVSQQNKEKNKQRTEKRRKNYKDDLPPPSKQPKIEIIQEKEKPRTIDDEMEFFKEEILVKDEKTTKQEVLKEKPKPKNSKIVPSGPSLTKNKENGKGKTIPLPTPIQSKSNPTPQPQPKVKTAQPPTTLAATTTTTKKPASNVIDLTKPNRLNFPTMSQNIETQKNGKESTTKKQVKLSFVNKAEETSLSKKMPKEQKATNNESKNPTTSKKIEEKVQTIEKEEAKRDNIENKLEEEEKPTTTLEEGKKIETTQKDEEEEKEIQLKRKPKSKKKKRRDYNSVKEIPPEDLFEDEAKEEGHSGSEEGGGDDLDEKDDSFVVSDDHIEFETGPDPLQLNEKLLKLSKQKKKEVSKSVTVN